MGIKLPVLNKRRCRNLTVCGKVLSPEKRLKTLLTYNRPMVARYSSSGALGYIRILTGDRAGNHLHLDCASQDYFHKGRKPKVTHTKAQVVDLLEAAYGHEMDVCVIGDFWLPLDELPEGGMVRSIHTKTSSGDLSIELTGATFSVRGSPVRNVRWSIAPGSSEVQIRIRADRKTKVNNSYLQDALDWIQQQMALFILGKSNNGKE